MIRILWPSIRPKLMKEAYKEWVDKAVDPEDITIKIAVDTEQQRKELAEFDDVIVIGEGRAGAARPVHELTKRIQADPDDIIILASDDFRPTNNWDKWIKDRFQEFSCGALVVNDGHQKEKHMMTLPIMSMKCLDRINRIIYHPSYFHMWSDCEVYENLHELGLLRDVRKSHGNIVFPHKHYHWKGRKKDKYDKRAESFSKGDKVNFDLRMQLPVAERIKRHSIQYILKTIPDAGEGETIKQDGHTYSKPYHPIILPGINIKGLREGVQRLELLDHLLDTYGCGQGAGTYLDIGCNSGFYLHNLRGRFKKVIGIEKDQRYVTFSRRLYALGDKPVGSSVVNVDINKQRLKDWCTKNHKGKFEVITALSMIEYIKDQKAFVEDLFNATSHICIVEGHSSDIKTGADKKYEALLQSHAWQVIRLEEKTDPGTNASDQKNGRPLWVCVKWSNVQKGK